ncbi:MAG: HlyC/CorC family transporter [Bacteroidales bacterium]|nr:HlyC/CorC family transporter [Bacteroidales bacterium]
MEIVIILLLILLNGVLSMSEIALVSVRKSKLEADARRGDRKAQSLQQLVEEPDRFLSMIQIGITLIGIVNGLFSGDTLDDRLAPLFVRMGMGEAAAVVVAQVVIVLVVTYLTIVLGELVPKIVGLNRAEKVARIMVSPIRMLSTVAAPLVWLLSKSTNGIVRLLGIERGTEHVTEEEIKAMVNEGFEGGEVSEMERDIVENAFDLDNITVASVMTHRSDYTWLDIHDPVADSLQKVRSTLFTVYPVCAHSSENVLGVLRLKDFPLLDPQPKPFDLSSRLQPCNYVPESMSLYRALENFKKKNEEYAIVIDEYGAVQGIVTLHDIVEVLVGEITTDDEMRVVQRDENSWLVDGQLPFYELLETLDVDQSTDDLPYQTAGGLVLDILEHIPVEGERVEWNHFTIEVVDMDGTRIDKLLVKRQPDGQ